MSLNFQGNSSQYQIKKNIKELIYLNQKGFLSDAEMKKLIAESYAVYLEQTFSKMVNKKCARFLAKTRKALSYA